MATLLDQATLVMVPSADASTGVGKLYSTIPNITTSDPGWPESSGDFTFARNSVATRINSAGLIETMAVNVPRLDYS